MGGDKAPREIVAGTLLAAASLDARFVLVGDEKQIAPLVGSASASAKIEIAHASETIAMDEAPVAAVRRGAVTSMAKAFELVRDGEADAVFSAGNSGAFLAFSMLRLRPLPGIARPAFATIWPAKKGPMLVLDAGANVDCKPEWLAQFAVMGSAYSHAVLGVDRPRVGLLSIGEEEGKGNALIDAATPLLASAPIEFAGNVEGRDLLLGSVDVIVCDGFVGNVALKLAEGAGEYIFGALREAATQSLVARVGALLLRPKIREIRSAMDYREYGGAPVLGVRGISFVGHGRTDAKAVVSACRAAVRAVHEDLVAAIASKIAPAGEAGVR